MIIVKTIIEYRPLAAISHQVQLPQLSQLVTDSGFRYSDELGKITDAHLFPIQSPQDTQPIGIAHGFEQIGQLLIFPGSKGVPMSRIYPFLMNTATITLLAG